MHEQIEVCQAKTFTGIQDIFGSTPFNNVLYRNPKQNTKENSINSETVGDSAKKTNGKEALHKKPTPFVTSEMFHGLNKQFSIKSVIRSTSTIFYDLDDIAKRHSFHCLSEAGMSSANILKVMNLPECSGFKGQSNPIVQECSTQIRPALLPRDSMHINSKKVRKKYPNNDILSSEIFLRDSRIRKQNQKNLYYNIDVTNHQKFWSYAKYRTEYTKPVHDEKKTKKKDKGKRTEDPCPCQLFSYACPCTDEKSLTELAKNSKCLPLTDQVTSTVICTQDVKKKKTKHETSKEDKITNTATIKKVEKVEPVMHIAQKQDIPVLTDPNIQEKNKNNSLKKSHKIICPNCKEKVEALSMTEDDDSIKGDSQYASKELSSTAAYNCSTTSKSNKNKVDTGDICVHEPRCELIPVCQILPIDDIYGNQKSNTKRVPQKPIPRVIRITKACRHHPPCTVVPSCQRANVLRNNCEFIPPCLHRPRCVNLPLCVPLAKSFHYDELVGAGKNADVENTGCNHIPKCKLIPLCQHDSLTNNTEQHYNISTRVQNGCDFINDYDPSTYIMSPKPTLISNSPSPGQINLSTPNSPCCSCRSNKSCQYNCFQCKMNLFDTKESNNVDDGIIYIRDVGCQFQNKPYSPKDSFSNSKTSSASFDYRDVKSNKYYSNVHTLRYEDKFTNPILEGSPSPVSTDSVISVEIDSNCPSHGHGRYTKNQYNCGFRPKSAFVTAYANVASVSTLAFTEMHREGNKSDASRHRDTFPVKSRCSFLKGKCRRMFTAKRRRSSKPSHHFMNFTSRKVTAS